MTDKKKPSAAEEANDKRIEELLGKASNKQKREAIKYFEQPLDEFDALDNKVFFAWIASDGNKSIEQCDEMPLSELDAIIGLVDDEE